MGLLPARIELLDPLQIKACNAHSGLELGRSADVIFGISTAHLRAHAKKSKPSRISPPMKGEAIFNGPERVEERNALWKARHDAYWAARDLRPGGHAYITDVCVPISRLAECVTATQEDIRESNLIAPIVGHVGDGNFHVQAQIDLDNSDEVRRVEGFLERLVERALEMDGTCTGEHGVAQRKNALFAGRTWGRCRPYGCHKKDSRSRQYTKSRKDRSVVVGDRAISDSGWTL